MATGWAKLGSALGGDQSELAYQEGLALGAKTQNALAEARRRVDENLAREQVSQSLGDIFGGGMSPVDEGLAYGTLARSGINMGDVMGARGKQREFDTRAQIANADTTEADAQRLLLSLASSPQEQFYKVGGGYADKLHPDKGIVPLGDAMGGGGEDTSNQVELIKFVSGLDQAGWDAMSPQDRQAAALDILRNYGRTFDAGGVEYTTSLNPFRRGAPSSGAPASGTPAAPGAGPAAAPPAAPAAPRPAAPRTTALISPQEVGNNSAVVEHGKVLGRETAEAKMALPQAMSRFRNQTQQTDLVMNNIDKLLPEISAWTTGPLGKFLGTVWGTPAYDFQAAMDTIKANVGFQQLQQMRYESPTGGALGQVAVQELNFLQAALGNLNQAQSPTQVREMLGQVRTRYDQFKAAAEADFAAAQQKAQMLSPGAAAPGAVPEFATEAEAAAAGLAPGTRVKIGGVMGTWQ